MIGLILAAILVVGPCTADDLAYWKMGEATHDQAEESYADAQQAFAKGETEIGEGTRDVGDRLMDDADGYWSEIPSACQDFLVNRGTD